MSSFDLVIRNGQVITPEDVVEADLGIADGQIVAIEAGLDGSAAEEIDAAGLHVFPGLIDSHVHFNDPGRSEWEGIESGSRALAAGGGTMFFDMPLNAHPPTIDADAFDQKLAVAKKSSLVDFGLWGGIVPGNLDKLAALSDRGVIGFKAFMSNSGIDDFPCVDDRTLREAMKRSADLGRIVALHAESEAITSKLTAQCLKEGKIGFRDYLASRPVEAEVAAITRALKLAGETDCHIHIVHVSSSAGLALIAAAQPSIPVTCETCPHYLVLTEEDLPRLGALAKCAPPLRSREEQDALWEHLHDGVINTIGSDHSPCPPEMKQNENFFKAWGGISGVQHTLPLLLTGGDEHIIPLPLLAGLFSSNVAWAFGLPPEKGALKAGNDADLVLVDLEKSSEVKREDLLDRHRQSPYVGRALKGKIIRTVLRGQTIFKDGTITAKPAGRLAKPVLATE
jgi:allantoinase